MKRRLSEKEGR